MDAWELGVSIEKRLKGNFWGKAEAGIAQAFSGKHPRQNIKLAQDSERNTNDCLSLWWKTLSLFHPTVMIFVLEG